MNQALRRIKIRFLFTLVLSVVLFLSFENTSKTIVVNDCEITNNVFANGEKLVYKLYYNLGIIWIPAGEVVFTIKENSKSYEMTAIGKTYKNYEKIFKVNDYFYSNVDRETLFPKNFVRIIEEGNYKLYDSIYFDQKRNIVMSFNGKTKEEARPKIHRVGECMQDMVSNIYYMRNLNTDNIKKGDKIAIKMFFDKEVFPIDIVYNGKEKKDIKDLGTFRTIKIQPNVVAGNVFRDGDKMTLWISDDANKLPLLIESPVSVGNVKAVLKSYTGLKHRLDSEIID